MNEIQHTSPGSPFDQIRRQRPDGTEWWSARDLMPLLGYDRWENFSRSVEEAKRAAQIAAGEGNLRDTTKVVERANRGSINVTDVEMTRYGAYMVAMSCDGRKPEVAAAKTYFAQRTREAETASNVRFLVPTTMAGALRMAADEYERAEAAEEQARMLEARAKKDAPLVAKAEAHSESTSSIHRQAFAREVKQWGHGRGIKILHEQVFELLRRKKMLIAGDRTDRNNATSHAVESGWARTVKGTTENGRPWATTYLSARGQDIAWKWITAHVETHGDLRMNKEGGAA